MPSNATDFAYRIRVFRDRTLSPAGLSHLLATTARRKRDEFIARGDVPNNYLTFVDGRRGASEDTVRSDGVILYQFGIVGLAAQFALGYLIARSPVRDGDYRKSWIVAVNGQKWLGDLNEIPVDAEVRVVNPLPYARKIDVGHMRMSVPHALIEGARQATHSRFPTLKIEREIVTIPAALGGGYILKGRFRRGHRLHARTRLRSDTQAGAEMTYPALILTSR